MIKFHNTGSFKKEAENYMETGIINNHENID